MTELKRYRSVVADSARWEGFPFRAGDIVISTPPKCGTTWMQRLVALLVFDDVALHAPVAKISPWLDMQLAPLDEVLELLSAQTHRRFIKTHTPLDGVPYDERVSYICVGRDPRDVAVSSAHHMSNMDVDRFLSVRESAVGMSDLAEIGLDQPGPPPSQSPEQALHTWIAVDSDTTPMTLSFVLTHQRSCWERRDRPNVQLFHYDDLLRDLPGQMRRLADALDIAVTDERIAALAPAATFDAMRSRADEVAPNADIALWRNTTEFFHRGTSGQWRDVFTDEHLKAYEERLGFLAPPDLADWLHNGWSGLPEAQPRARRA